METTFSRNNDKREWKLLDNNIIELIAYNVLYCNINGQPYDIKSIDPDGGPFISINSTISIGNDKYKVLQIVKYIHDTDDDLLTVYFYTNKINDYEHVPGAEKTPPLHSDSL